MVGVCSEDLRKNKQKMKSKSKNIKKQGISSCKILIFILVLYSCFTAVICRSCLMVVINPFTPFHNRFNCSVIKYHKPLNIEWKSISFENATKADFIAKYVNDYRTWRNNLKIRRNFNIEKLLFLRSDRISGVEFYPFLG